MGGDGGRFLWVIPLAGCPSCPAHIAVAAAHPSPRGGAGPDGRKYFLLIVSQARPTLKRRNPQPPAIFPRPLSLPALPSCSSFQPRQHITDPQVATSSSPSPNNNPPEGKQNFSTSHNPRSPRTRRLPLHHPYFLAPDPTIANHHAQNQKQSSPRGRHHQTNSQHYASPAQGKQGQDSAAAHPRPHRHARRQRRRRAQECRGGEFHARPRLGEF